MLALLLTGNVSIWWRWLGCASTHKRFWPFRITLSPRTIAFRSPTRRRKSGSWRYAKSRRPIRDGTCAKSTRIRWSRKWVTWTSSVSFSNFNFTLLLLNLSFVVSPDILDEPSSHDVIVQEFENVTLSCTATGSPGEFNESLRNDLTWFSSEPTIFWKREGQSKPLNIDNKECE